LIAELKAVPAKLSVIAAFDPNHPCVWW